MSDFIDYSKEAVKAARLGNNYIEPWVGVDLDCTLAKYDGYVHETHIGEPIQPMVDIINDLVQKGVKVKIFTARVSERDPIKYIATVDAIDAWTYKVFGFTLPTTCIKDYGMLYLYDDRAKQVFPNTGIVLEDYLTEGVPE